MGHLKYYVCCNFTSKFQARYQIAFGTRLLEQINESYKFTTTAAEAAAMDGPRTL